VIGKEFGAEYQLPAPRIYSTKSKGAQEAHEAIRPANLEAMLPGVGSGLKDRGEIRLYDLIWKRTIASQMKEALLEQTAVDIEANTPRKRNFPRERPNGRLRRIHPRLHRRPRRRREKRDRRRLAEIRKRNAAHARKMKQCR
jgi:DNA topoisomerase IA